MEFKQLKVSDGKTSRDEATGRLRVCGYAAVFGNEDSSKDIIESGAFTKTLKSDKGRIRVCKDHNFYSVDSVIAKLEIIQEDEKGLYVEFLMSASCEDLAVKIEEGIIDEMSIGYAPVVWEYDEVKGIRLLKEVKLFEFSLVNYAANEKAKVKSYNFATMTEYELQALYDESKHTMNIVFNEFINRKINK